MILVTLLLLAAELPDAGSPTFPVLCGSYGGFVGGVVATAKQRPIGPAIATGTLVGFGVGLVCWLVSVAMDVL